MSKWVTVGVLVVAAASACVLKTNPNTPLGSSSRGGGDSAGTGGGGDGFTACDAVDRPANADGVPLALACDRGFPIGAPVRGEGIAKDGTRTESGVSANWTCPGGKCNFYCKGGFCTAACEGGNCNMTCIDMATCKLDCQGGNCKTNCVDTNKDGVNAGTCESDCLGGKCATTCDPAHTTCQDTCQGGDCTTAQK
jgi:hypothetical protein